MIRKEWRIRPMRRADYPAVAELAWRAQPWESRLSADEIAFVFELPDEVGPVILLVAVVGDAVIGYGALRHFPNLKPLWVHVAVDPESRRRGIGSALLHRLLRRVRGAEGVVAAVSAASEGGEVFARRHGFTEEFRYRESRVELASFRPERFRPTIRALRRSGVRFRSLAEADSPELRRRLHALECATVPDIPSPDPPKPLQYNDWVRLWFESPRSSPATVVIAFDGSTPVAFSHIRVGADRVGYNFFTTVARGYRGRGLATAVKVEALRRAKAEGVTEVRTDNDVGNEPMLAVNAKLGYRPLPALIRFTRHLDSARTRITGAVTTRVMANTSSPNNTGDNTLTCSRG